MILDISRTTRLALGFAVLLLPLAAQTPRFNIDTAAGNGTAGFLGDAAQATAAELNVPCGVSFDSSGNLYITDQANQRIRKVTTDGNITTIAGDGTANFSGDGAAASKAQIYSPCGMAWDSNGNLLFTDGGNSVVRKIASGGNISTVAGSDVAGYYGDTLSATVAQLNHPQSIAIDSKGVLYIADTANNRIRKVTSDGSINLVAGNGFGGHAGDGGPALSASINNPRGIVVDKAGSIYFSDTDSNAVRRITTDGNISTVAGTFAAGFSGDGGAVGSARLNSPRGLAFDSAGNLYIADTINNRIRVILAKNGTVTSDCIIDTVAGTGIFGDSGDGGPALSAQLNYPTNIAIASNGKIYFTDTNNHRVKVLTPSSTGPGNSLPVISSGGVVLALDYGGGTTIAPGAWIEIYGTNLASNTRSWRADDFDGSAAPTILDGTRIFFGRNVAFISYISPTHLIAQVPLNVGTGAQKVSVTAPAGASAQYTVNVATTQPGLSAPAVLNIGGKQYATALQTDGKTWVLPTGAVAGLTSRPARPGETITFYGIGFGSVDPFIDAGTVVGQTNSLTTPLTVKFGSTPAVVSYFGLAPGSIGLYQFNVVVPAMADNDAVPLTFTLGGTAVPQTLYTSVKN